MTNQLFLEVLDGKIPVPRPWHKPWIFTVKPGVSFDTTGWTTLEGHQLTAGINFAKLRRVFLNQLINAQDKCEHHHVAPVIGWIDEWPPLPGDELDWIIQDDTNPRARALAAKQRLGHGPPSAGGWRGRERTTKFRSQ